MWGAMAADGRNAVHTAGGFYLVIRPNPALLFGCAVAKEECK